MIRRGKGDDDDAIWPFCDIILFRKSPFATAPKAAPKATSELL
jgi:hypothetical protein